MGSNPTSPIFEIGEVMQVSRNDIKFMDLAIAVARSSECRYLHGSVIAFNGRPLIAASNIDDRRFPTSRYSHLIQRHFSQSAKERRERSDSIHAECHCILKARCDLRGAVLYSARVNRKGDCASSLPCAACWQMIQIVGIKTIVWFDNNGIILKERV